MPESKGDAGEPAGKPLEFTHRLPAIPASQLLASQQSQRLRIRTGAAALDNVFSSDSKSTGLELGSLVELSGPPGSGKTTIAAQLVVNSIAAGRRTLWIDTSYQVRLSRVRHLLGKQHPELDAEDSLRLNFDHMSCPSLTHLAALFLRPREGFPGDNVGIIVLDSISVLFNMAYPPTQEEGLKKDKKDKDKENPSLRKFSVMTELVKGFRKIASTKDCSIIVINQVTTRIVSGVGAVLQPSVVSPNWNISFSYRLFLYRKDSVRKVVSPADASQVRRIAILAANGKAYQEGEAPSIAIAITDDGVSDVMFEVTGSQPIPTQPAILGKRKRTHGSLDEIPDSDDDDDDDDDNDEGQEYLNDDFL